jgi:purine-cytosine permease-like protein
MLAKVTQPMAAINIADHFFFSGCDFVHADSYVHQPVRSATAAAAGKR